MLSCLFRTRQPCAWAIFSNDDSEVRLFNFLPTSAHIFTALISYVTHRGEISCLNLLSSHNLHDGGFSQIFIVLDIYNDNKHILWHIIHFQKSTLLSSLKLLTKHQLFHSKTPNPSLSIQTSNPVHKPQSQSWTLFHGTSFTCSKMGKNRKFRFFMYSTLEQNTEEKRGEIGMNG